MKKIKLVLVVLIITMSMFSCLDPAKEPAKATAVVAAINGAIISGMPLAFAAKLAGEKKGGDTLSATPPKEIPGGHYYVIKCKDYAGVTGNIYIKNFDGSVKEKVGYKILAPALSVKVSDYKGSVRYEAENSVKFSATNISSALEGNKLKLNFKGLDAGSDD